MTYKTKFVTEMIVNVTMFTGLDKNVNKILFLDVNVNNFLLDENINIFLLEENVNNFFYLNVSVFYWTKKC